MSNSQKFSKILGLATALVLPLVLSCGGGGKSDKNGGDGSGVTPGGGHVYVAGGYRNSTPILWKDGSPTILDSAGASYCELNSVFVSGSGDVYVAGWLEYKIGYYATLWKNGTPTRLGTSTSAYMSEASSVFVSGNDVYVAGMEVELVGDFGYGRPTLWKNGIPTRLGTSTSAYTSEASSVFVSGNNVYVAGTETDRFSNSSYRKYPTLWKNGVHTRLSLNDSEVYSVFVSGNDVYVAGSLSDSKWNSTLWKNDSATLLPSGTYAASVYVR